MRINRIGFHHRFVGGIIQVAVSGSVGEPDIPYLSAWHDPEYQADLQIGAPARQLLGKSPVLLDPVGDFQSIDISKF